MATLFHINPKTGNPNRCGAKLGNCPFGEPEEHYGTKEAAAKGYEEFQQANLFPETAKKRRNPTVINGIHDGQRAIVDGRPGHWSTSITSGFGRTARPTFFADDAGLQDAVESLPKSFSDDATWRTVRRPAVEDGALTGLEEAQAELLRYENKEGEFSRGEATDYLRAFDGPLGNVADEMTRRILGNERSAYDGEKYNRNFKQIAPKEKLFYAATDPDSSVMSHNVLDLALAFPDRDLYPELKRVGVEQVSVSTLKNTREVGLVYTVMTPSGDTRSFSVYEHRNSDSLIINGTTNWDPETKAYGPYSNAKDGSNSKNHFFAEFSPDTPKRQIANTMAFLLKNAQNGELESDQDLIAKAEHLDWGAILSKRVPGFAEWLAETKKDATPSEAESMRYWEDKW